MRASAYTTALTGLVFVAMLGTANAAPQVIAMVPSDGAVTLTCDGAECGAEFSTICLQQARFTPAPGTPYRVHEADHSGIALTGRDGNGRSLSLDPDLMRYASVRQQTAVRISIPKDVLQARGLDTVSVTVSQFAVLVPVPVQDDPDPQTPDDIADARDTLAVVGPIWRQAQGEPLTVARLINGMLNVLPADSQGSDGAPAAAGELAAATGLSDAALARGRGMFEHCRETGAYAAGYTMRHCLGNMHDLLMRNLNHDYWDASKLGS